MPSIPDLIAGGFLGIVLLVAVSVAAGWPLMYFYGLPLVRHRCLGIHLYAIAGAFGYSAAVFGGVIDGFPVIPEAMFFIFFWWPAAAFGGAAVGVITGSVMNVNWRPRSRKPSFLEVVGLSAILSLGIILVWSGTTATVVAWLSPLMASSALRAVMEVLDWQRRRRHERG